MVANATDAGTSVEDDVDAIGGNNFHTGSVATDTMLIRIRGGNRSTYTPEPNSVRSFFHLTSCP